MATDHDHPVDPARVTAAKARLIDTEEVRRLGGLLGLLADPTRARILCGRGVDRATGRAAADAHGTGSRCVVRWGPPCAPLLPVQGHGLGGRSLHEVRHRRGRQQPWGRRAPPPAPARGKGKAEGGPAANEPNRACDGGSRLSIFQSTGGT